MVIPKNNLVSRYWIDTLKKGIIPWYNLWAQGQPVNGFTGELYPGVNGLLLGISPFRSPVWVSEHQLKVTGVKLRAKAKPFYTIHKTYDKKLIPRHAPWEQCLAVEKEKYVFVETYNIEQTITKPNASMIPARKLPKDPLAIAKKIVFYMPKCPEIRHGNFKHTTYNKSTDQVLVNNIQSYGSKDEYYLHLFHELIHSTGHVNRLGRKSLEEICPLGEDRYSEEELIAQIGSAALCWTANLKIPDSFVKSKAEAFKWLDFIESNFEPVIDAMIRTADAIQYVTGALSYHLAMEEAA